jgi:hypothetical protein
MQATIWLSDDENGHIEAKTVWSIEAAATPFERGRIVAYCGHFSLSLNVDTAERLGRALLNAATARRAEIEALGQEVDNG